MLNVILYLYQKRNDVPSGLDFPTKDLPPVSYSDVTNSVLEDGISINKRMEYDDFESIAFDTCEITFSETPVIKDYLIRQLQKNLFVVLIEIRFSGDLIFFGIIQQNSIVRNRYNETISCKADSLLKNLIDFWDNIPLPYYNFLNNKIKQPAIINYKRVFPNGDEYIYENVFEAGLREYQTSNKYFNDNIEVKIPRFFLYTAQIPPAYDYDNSSLKFYFQNIQSNEPASYNRLQRFSYNHFFVDNIHYDRFTLKDFLIECAKYYGFSITLDKNKKIRFISKNQLVTGITDLTDKIIENFVIEYDYKPDYDGVIMHIYGYSGGSWNDGWYVFRKNTPVEGSNAKYSYVQFLDREPDKKTEKLIDLRFNFYNNFKSNNASSYIRGYTKNSVVFYTLSGFFAIQNKPLVIWDNLEIYDYFNNSLLKKTNLIRTEVYGIDYQIGNFYEIDGLKCILLEQRLNLYEEKSELILRTI